MMYETNVKAIQLFNISCFPDRITNYKYVKLKRSSDNQSNTQI